MNKQSIEKDGACRELFLEEISRKNSLPRRMGPVTNCFSWKIKQQVGKCMGKVGIVMDLEKDLRKEKERVEKWLQRLDSEIRKLKKNVGDDKLKCGNTHGHPQYFLNGKYLSKKNLSKAQTLAQLEYDEKMQNVLMQKKIALDRLLQFYNENIESEVYTKLCLGRQELITPIVHPKEKLARMFLEENYKSNPVGIETKTEYYTHKGERVRSKAEKIIADELFAYNVLYQYEYPLQLLVDGVVKTYYPDFRTLNTRTQNVFYIEHLGMMDKLGYYNHNLDKINVMERNGFMLGINLLVFHETSESPISVSVVRRYIEEYLI